MIFALLFKAPTETDDEYVTLLQANNVRAKCIPVLDFDFSNLDFLLGSIQHPTEYSGVVFTSPRAVEAVKLALNGHEDEWQNSLRQQWQEKKTFVVGEATKSTAQIKLGLDGVAGSSGNAEALSQEIVKCISPNNKPVLFPCGNLKKETLPKILKENHISLKPVTVYFTKPHKDLKREMARAKDNVNPECSLTMVFFSPSGVKYAIPVVQELGFDLKMLKFVALGPSTADALRDSRVEVSGVAEQPSLHGLLRVLCPE